ncbi:hypothetical protein GLOIN_2v1551947 [Rhizophagus irregularis DAOM 181602=DAOM 197198]|uniref:Uncharacterized protein n=1 Tax=Rhizophagus irregularis (strain DAOM 181602 / DAOM 197198 / MUCL 43194) TaxID=747089 RepID=A0A2P4QH70_RHIID|nr:hypothetical protein GLOIN_2v1551947 [Rhizophagus irregularis DAOM 181602=DAOM 197198]POG76970.1 hypothetical protein GLOIN_2v1551947 [Rhizophagus irregularis DAOM 181602=DAOM 197198]|eukprot:XP_025183836.1 hypothetical protein GLOIN_2v1551947 [Rhizophagus irregularis DAOM 181602=DAOM 197198]
MVMFFWLLERFTMRRWGNFWFILMVMFLSFTNNIVFSFINWCSKRTSSEKG